MTFALVILMLVLYVAVCWQQHQINTLEYQRDEQVKETKRWSDQCLVFADKYKRQSDLTTDIVVAITPLIEKTNWLGPQPYGTGLPQLQAMEEQRNKTIDKVRGKIMSLPVVQDQPVETLVPKIIGGSPGI